MKQLNTIGNGAAYITDGSLITDNWSFLEIRGHLAIFRFSNFYIKM